MSTDMDAKARAINIVRRIMADGLGALDTTDPATAANVALLIHAVEEDLVAIDLLHAQRQAEDLVLTAAVRRTASGSDISGLVGRMIAIALRPYQDFVASLHHDGRITVDEIAELRTAYTERLNRLTAQLAAALNDGTDDSSVH